MPSLRFQSFPVRARPLWRNVSPANRARARHGRAIALIGASLALMAVLATPLARADGGSRFNFDRTPGHLSKQVVPSRYQITLDLDPDRDSFTGRAAISVRVRSQVPDIELHAFELNDSRARLSSGGAWRNLTVTPIPQTQTWRLVPEDGLPIAAGTHRLDLAYVGKVHSFGEGLYVAPYAVNGQPRRMLATQLESIFARTVFPSFDEPSFRASFEITVRAPSAYEVVSNMPRTARRADGPTTAVHTFAATPSMPSYLVSVAVGRFDVLAGQAAGVALRILTAEGKKDEARNAMAATRQVLPFYNAYFGVPYALPKLDQLAVPGTRSGAMEDWGLISYVEDAVLVDPARSGPSTLRQVYRTIAHEVAHQWFGNLVTAASWEEIWLNEAFATWLEQRTTDHFHPDWQLPLQARGELDEAMRKDAGNATRAIRSGPVQESAVFDVFDGITYNKGGRVLTMLESWIGPAAFQRGLQAYVKAQRLSNATAADLWHHIGRASGRDVAAVAGSWTDRPGFPLVQVSLACEDGRQRLRLTQQRFSLGTDDPTVAAPIAAPITAQAAAPKAAPVAAQTLPWKIPLRYRHGDRTTTVLFDTPQREIDLGVCRELPVVVNAGDVGYFRVAYAPAMLQALTRQFVALAPADRVALLSDAFALVQAGLLPLPRYFDLLAAATPVTDASRTILLRLAGFQLSFLDQAMAGHAAQAQVRAFARNLLAPQLAQLTWLPKPGEDRATSELRGALIRLLAQFDHVPTQEQATLAFDADDAGTAALPASLRSPITLAAGVQADQAHFDRLLARLLSATRQEERWTLVRALASGRNAQHAEVLLAASLNATLPADIATALPAMVAEQSPFGELAYRFTLDNFKALADRAGSIGRTFLLPAAAAGFTAPEQASQLIEDQRLRLGSDGDSQAAQEAENIRLRAAVRLRQAPALQSQPGS